MKAMILAAGRGERLRPLTDTVPKPLVPIAGKPLIVHQLGWLRRAGVREIVINVWHLADQIVACLQDGSAWGVRIRWSRESELLDTGGGIANARHLLGAEPFILLNGDIWADYDFARLVDRPNDDPHLVLTPKPEFKPTGDFSLVGDRVARPEPSLRTLTYCGIAVLQRSLFSNIDTPVFSLTRDFLFQETRAGRVSGEIFLGAWYDIGTPTQLNQVRKVAE